MIKWARSKWYSCVPVACPVVHSCAPVSLFHITTLCVPVSLFYVVQLCASGLWFRAVCQWPVLWFTAVCQWVCSISHSCVPVSLFYIVQLIANYLVSVCRLLQLFHIGLLARWLCHKSTLCGLGHLHQAQHHLKVKEHISTHLQHHIIQCFYITTFFHTNNNNNNEKKSTDNI